MRHQSIGRKLSRTSSHRRSLLRNLATSFIAHEQIETTYEKAKDLQRVVENLISDASTESLPARRKAYAYLLDKKIVHKLFSDVAPRCNKARKGGFTRVVRTRRRSGDAAEMAIIELVDKVILTPAATRL